MKIVFIKWGVPYLPGYAYQENRLATVAVQQGDEAVVVSSGYLPNALKEYIKDKELFQQPVMIDSEGVKIYRLSFRWKWIPDEINWRLGAFVGLREVLEKEHPDMVFLHDLVGWSFSEVADYIREHPECVLCADSHDSYKNSGRTFLSKNVLHRVLFRSIIRKYADMIDQFFYLTDEVLAFCRNENGLDLPENRITFLPLGDIVSPPEDRPAIREKILAQLSLPEDTILVVHSGKMVREKRTKELLEAFRAVSDDKMRLVIIGKIANEIEEEVKRDISRDPRVVFLGWKTGEELREYLIAADLYAQPGTESSTLESAMCCGCPVMLSPQDGEFKCYRFFLDDDKVFFIKTVEDMIQVLTKVSNDPKMLEQYREYSYQYAYELLDYKKQLEKIKSVKKK